MVRLLGICFAVFVLIAQIGVPHPAHAQSLSTVLSPILTIESDRFFAQSAFGLRVAAEVEAEGAVIAAENRRIEADLTAEEKSLTQQRATMAAESFRALADAFDSKVQTIRRTQDAKARALNQRQESDRIKFVNAAGPVLEVLMRDSGAAVILERRNVFLSANAIDVTEDAIQRMDAAIGDGSTLPEE
jgi:Skp family chaperone for outer membrane proteins